MGGGRERWFLNGGVWGFSWLTRQYFTLLDRHKKGGKIKIIYSAKLEFCHPFRPPLLSWIRNMKGPSGSEKTDTPPSPPPPPPHLLWIPTVSVYRKYQCCGSGSRLFCRIRPLIFTENKKLKKVINTEEGRLVFWLKFFNYLFKFHQRLSFRCLKFMRKRVRPIGVGSGSGLANSWRLI